MNNSQKNKVNINNKKIAYSDNIDDFYKAQFYILSII